jgi:hypothetical protein
VKSPLKILTTATVAGALVAGGIAGAAPAFADTENTVQPVISLPAPAVATVPALTATVPVALNLTAGDDATVTTTIAYNGAVFAGDNAYPDASGNATVDLIDQIKYDVASGAAPAAGTYTFTFSAAADDGYDFSTDPITHTTYLPAQSAPFTLTITKLGTTISGWKTKSKSAKYGKFIKVSSPTIHGLGPSAKVVFQYKKKGAKKWKTDESETTPSYTPADFKLTTNKFNAVHVHGKLKRLKRGTYYFRLVVKSSAYVNGATTKQIKLTWK